jgi:hypothetical protein
MIRATRTLSILVGLSANLIPLYGGLYWQWDSFQLLMLYWMETVIMAFWTILGITASPSTSSGPITVGGRVKPATHKLLWIFRRRLLDIGGANCADLLRRDWRRSGLSDQDCSDGGGFEAGRSLRSAMNWSNSVLSRANRRRSRNSMNSRCMAIVAPGQRHLWPRPRARVAQAASTGESTFMSGRVAVDGSRTQACAANQS